MSSKRGDGDSNTHLLSPTADNNSHIDMDEVALELPEVNRRQRLQRSSKKIDSTSRTPTSATPTTSTNDDDTRVVRDVKVESDTKTPASTVAVVASKEAKSENVDNVHDDKWLRKERISSNLARDQLGMAGSRVNDDHRAKTIGDESKVQFEIFDKMQMKNFFRSIWGLIGLALLYVLVNLSQVAACSGDDLYDIGFKFHVQTYCLEDQAAVELDNATAHDVKQAWAACCHATNASGTSVAASCLGNGNETSREWVSCCVLDFEEVFNACPSQCMFEFVNVLIRVALSIVSLILLLIYLGRFCTYPKSMRRFEQKLVAVLFVLTFVISNPFVSGLSLYAHLNTDDGSFCVASEDASTVESQVTLVRNKFFSGE